MQQAATTSDSVTATPAVHKEVVASVTTSNVEAPAAEAKTTPLEASNLTQVATRQATAPQPEAVINTTATRRRNAVAKPVIVNEAIELKMVETATAVVVTTVVDTQPLKTVRRRRDVAAETQDKTASADGLSQIETHQD
ncbi:hypothetical protein GKO28_12135 [Deefgea sp. CFH1-16]|nr:hypothetical protein [Deefgea sp. CFH1-16]MBM5574895.1 hypothetical protein [Deefgea sp. CFH1-16]